MEDTVKVRVKTFLSDDCITDMYWNRDENAIKETDAKYRNYLHKIAKNIVHDESDTEECLNDAYLGAWNSIPPHRPTSLRSYLSKIVRRVSIDCYKKKSRKRRVPSEYTLSLSELSETLSGGDNEYEAKVLGEAISRYLRTLSERERCIFMSRYYFSDKISSIAQMFDMSESSINKILSKQRIALKEFLESEGIFL